MNGGTSVNPQDPMTALPSEISFEIFTCFTPTELLLITSLVCKLWKQFSEDENLWKHLVDYYSLSEISKKKDHEQWRSLFQKNIQLYKNSGQGGISQGSGTFYFGFNRTISTWKLSILYPLSWNTLSELCSKKTFETGHKNKITCIELSNNYIFTGSSDKTIKIFKHLVFSDDVVGVNSSEQLEHIQTLEGLGKVSLLKVVNISHPNNSFLCSVSNDVIQLWNFSIKETTFVQTLKGSQAEDFFGSFRRRITSLEVTSSMGSIRIYSGNVLGEIYIWGLDQIDEASPKFNKITQAHEGEITSLSTFSLSEIIASASVDRTIKIWHPSTSDKGENLQCLQVIKNAHDAGITNLLLCSLTNRLISADFAGTIKLWGLQNQDPANVWCLDNNQYNLLDTHKINEVLDFQEGASEDLKNNRIIHLKFDNSFHPVTEKGINKTIQKSGMRVYCLTQNYELSLWANDEKNPDKLKFIQVRQLT